MSDGLATLDLSADFASGDGTFSVRGRLAQVVYTLTPFNTARVRSARPSKVSEHREDATVIVRGGLKLQLGEDAGDVGLDRLPRHPEAIADGLVGSALRHQPQDIALPRRQVVERDPRAAADEDRDHGRVDDRTAFRDPLGLQLPRRRPHRLRGGQAAGRGRLTPLRPRPTSNDRDHYRVRRPSASNHARCQALDEGPLEHREEQERWDDRDRHPREGQPLIG